MCVEEVENPVNQEKTGMKYSRTWFEPGFLPEEQTKNRF